MKEGNLFKSHFSLFSGHIVRIKNSVFRFETGILTQSND